MIKNLAKKHTGFTLVELLVVIVIIGLLSTIVIVSFGTVRTQAADTAIKANMSQMRLAAEMHYSNNANYMDADSRLDYAAALSAANAAGATNYNANFSASAYCISFTLKGGTQWCIDSNGNIGGAAASDVCNKASYKCE